jgi:predicted enzyme related to lactoylglutathione lyase
MSFVTLPRITVDSLERYLEQQNMPTIQPIIATSDLARLQTFYERLLGAVEVRRFPDDGSPFFVGLKLGDSELGLVNEAAIDPSVPQRILLSVDVDDVNGLLDRVEVAGGRLLGPSTDMPWGQRVAHVHDPDGNMVNLTQSL